MDETSVGDAYRLYAAAVWRRCVTILRDDARALDVTQEVFMKCLRHHFRLRCGPELMGWLYRVATNLCLNELRDQKTRGAGSDARAADEGRAEPTCEPDAVARLMTAEVFQGLDRRSQEVAIYVFVDGMTHAEASRVAGVSERTVRNWLSRFLTHGRERLGIELQEEP